MPSVEIKGTTPQYRPIPEMGKLSIGAYLEGLLEPHIQAIDANNARIAHLEAELDKPQNFLSRILRRSSPKTIQTEIERLKRETFNEERVARPYDEMLDDVVAERVDRLRVYFDRQTRLAISSADIRGEQSNPDGTRASITEAQRLFVLLSYVSDPSPSTVAQDLEEVTFKHRLLLRQVN